MATKPVSVKAKSAKAPAKKTPSRASSARGARSGKKLAEKRPEGRPPKYSEPELMIQRVKAYFAELVGDADKPDRPPTMAGLALALGFVDRQSLLDYEAKPEFSGVIKGARLRIQVYWESRLAGNAPTGSIFWLKNHAGYADKQELTGANGGPLVLKLTSTEAAL